MHAQERTVSLWSYVNRPEVLPKYLNPVYEPNQRVIWPSVAPMSLVSIAYFVLHNSIQVQSIEILLDVTCRQLYLLKSSPNRCYSK